MAFNLTSDDDDLAETSEINVTPFIDVILVLLIIFMIAAPLSTVDIPVELPVASAKPQPRPQKPVFITLKDDLTLSVGEKYIERSRLASVLNKAMQRDHDQRLFIRADKTVTYGDIMKLINELRANGYLKIAFVGLEDAAIAQPAP